MAFSTSRYLRFALLGPLAVYFLWACLLILPDPGLQYDEALLVLGSVHMRHQPHSELTLPHDPDTWVQVWNRWFPLMTVRYVGAIKEYLCLPVFALLGPSADAIRAVSALLAAIGIWGLARLVRGTFGSTTACAAAALVAINPAYAAMTVFDNGTVSIFMAAFGLLAFAVSRHIARPSAMAAFAIGGAAGFGIWSRANFVWLLAAAVVAIILSARRESLPPIRHLLAASLGALAGGSPFLLYQVVSGGATWRAVNLFSYSQPLSQRLWTRLPLFAEAMLSDAEHRVMWSGPPLPLWQPAVIAAVVVASCLVCLFANDGKRLARGLAITFVVNASVLLTTRVDVAQHHLVTLVPLAAVLTGVAGQRVVQLLPRARILVIAIGVVYAASAIYWHLAGVNGLRSTGGQGLWSDGVYDLAQLLETKYASREIKILDWGLQNNLYVISDGALKTREIYGDASADHDERGRPWIEEVAEGGVYVVPAPGHRQFKTPVEGFLLAVSEGQPTTRRFGIRQRDGSAYAEVLDIQPRTARTAPPSVMLSADSRSARQIEGFHPIDQGVHRWTKRLFAVKLGPPDSASGLMRFKLRFYIPPSSIEKLGPMTLAVRLGSHDLMPETFRTGDEHSYQREFPADWLQPGGTRVEFALDKVLAPSAADRRELGIVVMSAAIEPSASK